MQTLGILLISFGIWVAYSGLWGINPLTTARRIIERPAQARTILDNEKLVAQNKWADVIGDISSAINVTARNGQNPYASRKVTSDFDAHLDRGSLGGIDYAAPVGTPIVATMPGVISNSPNNGTGGNTVTVTAPNGWREQYLHLSKFARANGTRVTPGAIIGYSGGTKGAAGAGSSTGPHIHWHYISPDGKRSNPLTNLGKGK